MKILKIVSIAMLCALAAPAASQSDPCYLNTKATAAMNAACKAHDVELHGIKAALEEQIAAAKIEIAEAKAEIERLKTPVPPAPTAQEIGWRNVQLAQAAMTDTAMPAEPVMNEALRALRTHAFYSKVNGVAGVAWASADWKARFKALTIEDVRADGGLIQA